MVFMRRKVRQRRSWASKRKAEVMRRVSCGRSWRADNAGLCRTAASILAKTARDELMLQLHEQYPHYGFAIHKGYPTAMHLKALAEHGVSDVHRRSFKPVRLLLDRAAAGNCDDACNAAAQSGNRG